MFYLLKIIKYNYHAEEIKRQFLNNYIPVRITCKFFLVKLNLASYLRLEDIVSVNSHTLLSTAFGGGE
jgi:hypothetical protein